MEFVCMLCIVSSFWHRLVDGIECVNISLLNTIYITPSPTNVMLLSLRLGSCSAVASPTRLLCQIIQCPCLDLKLSQTSEKVMYVRTYYYTSNLSLH